MSEVQQVLLCDQRTPTCTHTKTIFHAKAPDPEKSWYLGVQCEKCRIIWSLDGD